MATTFEFLSGRYPVCYSPNATLRFAQRGRGVSASSVAVQGTRMESGCLHFSSSSGCQEERSMAGDHNSRRVFPLVLSARQKILLYSLTTGDCEKGLLRLILL